MQKIEKVILTLSVIINIVLGYILYFKNNKTESNSKEFISKIDSLELELSNIEIIQDSVNKEIDTVFVELKVIEKEYEEKYNNILTNSISDDYLFFTNYLERNKERLDSIGNF